jgi:hypothetical protein
MEQPIRRRRRKKKTLDAKQLMVLAGCVIGVAALIIAACFIFDVKPEPGPEATQPLRTSMPDLTIGEPTRNGQSMLVNTSYMDVEFPYMFSDYIYCQPINQQNATALEFRVRTATMDAPLYTIWFNGNVGQSVGSFDPGDGQGTVPVTVVFHKAEEKLSQDDLGTFKATQESFNEVLASMQQCADFT